MYNGFSKLREDNECEMKQQQQRLSPLRFRNKKLANLKNRLLSQKSEQRRKLFLNSTITSDNDMFINNINNELLGGQLLKLQFRNRDRSKELCDQEFKTSKYEMTKERTDRIYNENQNALLFEKYKQKELAFKLRADNKTFSYRNGMRMNSLHENERINSVLQNRPKFDKEGINLELLNPNKLFRQSNDKYNTKTQNLIKSKIDALRNTQNKINSQDKNSDYKEPYYIHNFVKSLTKNDYQTRNNLSPLRQSKTQIQIKSILNASSMISNRQYEHFEKLQRFNQTLQNEDSSQNTKQSLNNTFQIFASDLYKTYSPQHKQQLKQQEQSQQSFVREITNISKNLDLQETTIGSIVNLSKYSPKKESIIMEFADDDIEMIDFQVKNSPRHIESTLKNIRKPTQQSIKKNNIEQEFSKTHKVGTSFLNKEENARVKTLIDKQWQRHVNETTSNFFDKNKIYMVSMSESQQYQQQKQKAVRNMLAQKEHYKHKRGQSFAHNSQKNNSIAGEINYQQSYQNGRNIEIISKTSIQKY